MIIFAVVPSGAAAFFLMTKEQEILNAAEEEFFRKGYDAASTAVIATRAGVTHAMVNYYFRTKENLFFKILDMHVYELLQSLKPVMRTDGDIVGVSVDAAVAIFDRINADRRLPYLLSDISRMHPDFLLRYRDTVETVCGDSIRMHSLRLEEGIRSGAVADCTMKDIYNTILSLATAPFLMVPMLENVAGLPKERIDAYLLARKEEMVKILKARYSA